MILITLFVLFLLASWLAFLKWRKTSWALYGCCAIFFFLIGCGPLPTILLRNLQSDYGSDNYVSQHDKHIVIILLGAGTEKILETGSNEAGIFAYGRITKALELYQSCKRANNSCKIIISGGDPQNHDESEAAVYGSLMTRLGMSSEDIVLEERSKNTWENAQFTHALLKSHPVDAIYLVSSGFHLRRSLLCFFHFGIVAMPIRGDYLTARFSFIPTSYNFTLTDLAVHEYIGILRYYVYNALGWNVPAIHSEQVS